MWYSSVRTGINDIDLDHANLDFLLDQVLSGTMEHQMLGKLLQALVSHFKHEEKVISGFGATFPHHHKQEHERLTEVLKAKEGLWREGLLSTANLALYVKECLLIHVVNYDIDLAALKPTQELPANHLEGAG